MSDTSEAILAAARLAAQLQGYAGLNFRDLAARVGIRSASLHYHFPTKADLGEAVARRYREDAALALDAWRDAHPDPRAALAAYPDLFRRALENDNRMCLAGFLSAEHDQLPDAVRAEVVAFADLHVARLAAALRQAVPTAPADAIEARARAIHAAVGGAQLAARGRADITVYDDIIAALRVSRLLSPDGLEGERARRDADADRRDGRKPGSEPS